MLRAGILGLMMLFISSCTTIQVKNEFNPKTDFSRLGTYAWLNETDTPSEDVRINNKLVVDSVRAAVEKTLDSKGFVKTDREQADFLITWFGAIDQKVKAENISHFYRPYGYGTLYRDLYWNSQPTVTKVTEYEEGSLIFDFLDPRSHELLWRGIGQDQMVAGQTEDKVKQNLDRAVSQIIAGFPPR